MEERNKGLIIFGAILLVIGLFASFYYVKPPYEGASAPSAYPYQTVGIVLDVAGMIFVALGLLYPSHRTTPPPPTNP